MLLWYGAGGRPKCWQVVSIEVTIKEAKTKNENDWAVISFRAVPDLFFSNPAGARFAGFVMPDLEWQIRPEPDFQIDCNFTNIMCKTLRKYEWFEFLIIFLHSSYRYDFLNFWIC